jgi:HPt (histidine-containing phosphotransfer) domain-containing protein
LTSSSHSSRRKSLYEKTQGPGAVPIETLIQHGDTAARLVSAGYLDFFRTRLPAVESLADALIAEPPESPNWKAFYTAVHDLRSSSASAGYQTVSKICESLEALLVDRDPNDVLMRDVIRLHLDALSVASAAGAPMPDGPESTRLITNLGRAVDKLARI